MSIGLFHTRLSISNALPGAPVLNLDLLVDTVNKRVSGIASVFQATWPTVNFRTQVWGSFSETKLTANVENHIILTLDGGPSGPLSQIAQTFHLRGILVAVHQAPSEQQHPTPHPQPLYAVAVQQAQTGGNLAQLKTVVQQAEQQVAHEGALRSALEHLKAEIARLETR
jgi:hypothetical protein